MNTKLTRNKDAVVAEDFYWVPISERQPPRNAKILLINKDARVATLGIWDHPYWTHWAGLPRFKENEDGNDAGSES